MPPKKQKGVDVRNLNAITPVNTRFKHDEDGKPICGAATRAGTTCKNGPMPNGRCRYHGGLSKKGTEHPNFKTGRYSKYLPKELGIMADDFASDPNRLDQTAQMAILDAMLVETLKDYAAGGGGSVWDELMKKREDYYRAQSRKDTRGMVGIVNEVMEMVGAGYTRFLASREAREIIDDRRKLTESERKRRIEEQSMIPVDQVILLLSKVGDSIRRHVSDELARGAILQDVLVAMGSFTQRQYDYYGHPEPESD